MEFEERFGTKARATWASRTSMSRSSKVFHPAAALIVGGGNLRVSSEDVPHPVAVRYAWQNWIVGSLFNNAGLPASSFSTDES
jgi:sialate O-acetylesterase